MSTLIDSIQCFIIEQNKYLDEESINVILLYVAH